MSPMTTYWIILAAGILLSAGLFIFFARLSGYSILRAGLGFLAGFPLAWILSKAVYVVINSHLPQIGCAWFSLKPEEFSFVAGCAGFCLGPMLLFIDCRKEIPGVLDQLALPGCLLAGAFRFGEIYLAAADISKIGVANFAFIKKDPQYAILLNQFPWSINSKMPRGTRIQVSPAVSTPAALLILGIAVYTGLLWWLSRRRNTGLEKGMVFERCVFLLCAFRIFWEMLNARMKFFFVPVDQVLCAIIIIALMIRTILRLKKATGQFQVWPFIALLQCLVLNAAAQFCIDGKNYLLSDEVMKLGNEILKDFRDEFWTMIQGLTVIFSTCIILIVVFGLLCLKVTNANRRKINENSSHLSKDSEPDHLHPVANNDYQPEEVNRKEETVP